MTYELVPHTDEEFDALFVEIRSLVNFRNTLTPPERVELAERLHVLSLGEMQRARLDLRHQAQ